MQKKLLFIFLSCFWLVSLVGAQGRVDNFALAKGDLIENLLFTYYDELGFNGSVLVVEDNQVIYENTFGFSDFENEDPLDATIPFYIASLSKQFMAAAILKLSEEGKLSLDDPLTKYLTKMPKFYNKVKIHHLLTHTAGIPDYFKLDIVKSGTSNQDVYQALLSQRDCGNKIEPTSLG
jgi:CubicO group peptidase (beta-lactamase class C family)